MITAHINGYLKNFRILFLYQEKENKQIMIIWNSSTASWDKAPGNEYLDSDSCDLQSSSALLHQAVASHAVTGPPV